MESAPSCWLPHSPFRRPSWRWLRATWLHEASKRPSRQFDDDWVLRARRFLAAEEWADHGNAASEGQGVDAAVMEAIRLCTDAHAAARWQLEALLLTDLPFEAVAARCSLSAETVEAFHQLHFDVRPHFAARDWIMMRAIGGDGWHGFAGQPLGALWRYAAYAAGPRALEVVIAVTTDQPLPDWLRASFIQNPVYEERRLRLKCKLAFAALDAESPDEMKALVEIHDQLRRLDRKMVGVPDQAPSMLEAMEFFLKSLARRPRSGKEVASAPADLRRAAHEVSRAPTTRPRRAGAALQG